jgi:NADH dehydrogenase [ubiquinone] 1 alpha subcomplex assembly factor 1
MTRISEQTAKLASVVLAISAMCTVLLAQLTAAAREPQEQVLFDFSAAEAGQQWQTVNDGVMGGRSDGRFLIAGNGTIEFFGTLSLENNGGFASVRSRARQLSLQAGDSLVARVRGDGRRYTLNLYVPRRRMAFSYRVEFQTKMDEWTEVRVPLKKFVATSFGRIVRGSGPVNPQQVNSIGFLLGDKKPGPFKLEVDWIKAEAARTGKSNQIVGSL